MALLDLLLARAPAEVSEELRANGEAEGMLRALVEGGRATHPGFEVDEEAWACHFARHLATGETGKQLVETRAGDVHLALGCLAGNGLALADFERRLREVAPRALAGFALERHAVDEILQAVRERLLVGHDGSSGPKLATYSGRGELDGWLRVTIARSALSTLRGQGAAEGRRDDIDAILTRAASDDPQLDALRRRCAPELTRAIEDAITNLSDGDRVLLRLHLVDGLSIDDLASLYGSHRATAARRLARVRSKIFDEARARAMDRLRVDEVEFESLMGLLLSGLDLTLSRLLRDGGAEGAE